MLLALLLLFATPPGDFERLSKQATTARMEGKTEEAVRYYKASLAARPTWAEGWLYLGTLLYDKNSFASAGDAFAQLVKYQPKASPAWAFLGLCEFETKQYADALAHLERGIALERTIDPDLGKVTRYHSALLLTYSGKFELALQRFSEVAKLGGNSPQLIPAMGLAALRMPALPTAIPAAHQGLVETAGRAVYNSSLRRPVEAQAAFEQLLKEYPNTPEVHELYGVFLAVSDPDGAVREWKKELEISPKHLPARLQLAFEYLRRGDADAGLPYAQEAVKLDAQSFAAHNALGRLLVETGNVPGGVAELERARDLAPDSPETRHALASAYAKAGRSENAAQERAEFQRLKALQEKPRQ